MKEDLRTQQNLSPALDAMKAKLIKYHTKFQGDCFVWLCATLQPDFKLKHMDEMERENAIYFFKGEGELAGGLFGQFWARQINRFQVVMSMRSMCKA